MDTVFEVNSVSRILISIVAVAIAVGPMIADFNKTHATNPLWPPHARFHVVWQVLTQSSVCGVILYLAWTDGAEYVKHVYLSAGLLYIWGIAFFATLGSMKLFDGALKDVNGIPPFRFNIMGTIREVDTNLFGCTILMIVNTVGVLLVQK